MSGVVVTGAGGLVGSEVVRWFARDRDVIGLDNDMRGVWFGDGASTSWQVERLRREFERFTALPVDIRHREAVEEVFRRREVAAVVHCAAQPSHDWAASNPRVDFEVNATGTLSLLEAARRHAPDAVFVHLSTNKVYGDRPNHLPLSTFGSRFDLAVGHPFYDGVDETMPVDQCLHSLFGASKLAADVMVQEYGRYFGLRTVCLRGGCLTGPGHSGTELHGFLAYMMKCMVAGSPYRVIGYGGRQVRDNIHALDLAEVIARIVAAPPAPGEVFNVGGGRENAVSVLEALELCQRIAGREVEPTFMPTARTGDHKWYITDNRKLRRAYPDWRPRRSLSDILGEIRLAMLERWESM